MDAKMARTQTRATRGALPPSKNTWVALLLALLCCVPAAAQEAQPTPAGASDTSAVPDVYTIVTAASQLEGKRLELQQGVGTLFQPATAEGNLSRQAEEVNRIAERLEAIKASSGYGYDQVNRVRVDLATVSAVLRRLSDQALEALDWLNEARSTWEGERKQWKSWNAFFPAEGRSAAVKTALREAKQTIELALDDLSSPLKPLLDFQAKTGEITLKLQSLERTAEGVSRELREQFFQKSSPSMFSRAYFRGLRMQDVSEVVTSVGAAPMPGWVSLEQNGWLLLTYLLAVAGLATRLYRKRDVVRTFARWRFLGDHPIASSSLAVAALLLFFPARAPRLLVGLVCALATARMAKGLFEDVWRRRVVYLLIALVLLTLAFRTLEVPVPWFRLYLLVIVAGGLPLCLWRAKVNEREGLPKWRVWMYLAWAVLLGVSGIANLGGYSALATHVLVSALTSTLAGLALWMVSRIAHGGLQYGLSETSLLGRLPMVRRNASQIRQGAEVVINVLAGVLGSTVVLGIWGSYNSVKEALAGVLAFGVTLGSYRLTLGLLGGAAIALYGSLLFSWALQDVLLHEVYPRRKVQWGVRLSINRLVHYGLTLIGFLIALGILGVNLQNITILAGSLGIGIGFGLQNTVNNFVSGLILLFERPVKVGDTIQLGQQWGTIERIGLRATIVETFDLSEVIVPNSDLISAQVTNWTLRNRVSRVIVPVGIAYGSDVPLAMKLLSEAAGGNPLVMKDPAPQVLFLAFGASSLDFELRVWVLNVDDRLTVKSELHQEIDRRFREAQVEIAFPQQDLHLRTVDENAREALASLLPTPTAGAAPRGKGRKKAVGTKASPRRADAD